MSEWNADPMTDPKLSEEQAEAKAREVVAAGDFARRHYGENAGEQRLVSLITQALLDARDRALDEAANFVDRECYCSSEACESIWPEKIRALKSGAPTEGEGERGL